MKVLKISFIFMCVFVFGKATACDICGCSMGITNLGILPQFHKNFVGLHYYNQHFSSKHVILGTEIKSITYEHFQTTELRGRFHLNNKIQLFVLLPFNYNKQLKSGITSSFIGLGDVSAFANYSIFNNGNGLNKKWKHNLQLGGGFKLPTGSYKKLDKSNILNPNIQTGSGSFDILLDAIYTVRYKKWGINNTAFYSFNRTNSNHYKFGNRLSLNSSFFYWATIKAYSLLPNIGIKFDKANKDIHNAFIIDQSGNNSIFTTFGLDAYYKNFVLGVNCHLPVYQKSLLTQNKLKFDATLVYTF